MHRDPGLSSAGNLDDPRGSPDYEPRHYPRINGREAPPAGATERNDRIILEFLSAYYALNCQYERLVRVRRNADVAGRREEEMTVLRDIERLLIVRDGLEDRYAPFGVIAEPVVRDGYTVDVKISFGNVDAFGLRRSEGYTLTACIPIPLPEGTTIEDYPVTIAGPGIDPK